MAYYGIVRAKLTHKCLVFDDEHFRQDLRLQNAQSYVPVKSKLKHPPGIWRLFLPGREGIWLPLIGVGNLITSLDFMLRVALIPHGSINRGGDGGDKLWVYLGVRTCEVFLCFVATVRVGVYYVDFFVFFVLRHWWVSQVLTPRQSPFLSCPSFTA